MTVEELRKKLKKFDPKAEVTVNHFTIQDVEEIKGVNDTRVNLDSA